MIRVTLVLPQTTPVGGGEETPKYINKYFKLPLQLKYAKARSTAMIRSKVKVKGIE